jgi:PadR family transcriptional regulator, regulatory protein PadR
MGRSVSSLVCPKESENNRKEKYYSITKSGRKQPARETENRERIAGVIGRLLSLEGKG